MKKYLTSLGLVAILIWTFMFTGCTQDDIEKSAKWGFQSSGSLRTSQRVILELFRGGVVSLNGKDAFYDAAASGFDVLEVWNDTVAEQQGAINDCQTDANGAKVCRQTPSGAKIVLQTLFKTKVLAAMNNIIAKLNPLDANKAGKLFSILRTVASGALKVMDILSIPRTELAAVKGGS